MKSVPYSDPKKIPCFPLLSSFWPRIECPERWPWALREDPASSWLGKTPFGLAKIRDDEWQNQRQTNKNIDIGWKIYWIPKTTNVLRFSQTLDLRRSEDNLEQSSAGFSTNKKDPQTERSTSSLWLVYVCIWREPPRHKQEECKQGPFTKLDVPVHAILAGFQLGCRNLQ